jgi:hypothetical protein
MEVKNNVARFDSVNCDLGGWDAAQHGQGAFAALLVPSALSLLTTTFTEPKDQKRTQSPQDGSPPAPTAVR